MNKFDSKVAEREINGDLVCAFHHLAAARAAWNPRIQSSGAHTHVSFTPSSEICFRFWRAICVRVCIVHVYVSALINEPFINLFKSHLTARRIYTKTQWKMATRSPLPPSPHNTHDFYFSYESLRPRNREIQRFWNENAQKNENTCAFTVWPDKSKAKHKKMGAFLPQSCARVSLWTMSSALKSMWLECSRQRTRNGHRRCRKSVKFWFCARQSNREFDFEGKINCFYDDNYVCIWKLQISLPSHWDHDSPISLTLQ